MDGNLAQIAVDLAIKCNWDEAIAVNNEIIKTNSTDIEALNRLSRAYYETNQIEKAKKTSLKVLKIDPNNQIALKAIEKYNQFDKSVKSPRKSINPSIFIEEAGKTKIVSLINLSSSSIYSCLDYGDEVFLLVHPYKISVVRSDKKYIGRLPDDVSVKIKKSIKKGARFKAYIKSIKTKGVEILIKEVFMVESKPIGENSSQSNN